MAPVESSRRAGGLAMPSEWQPAAPEVEGVPVDEDDRPLGHERVPHEHAQDRPIREAVTFQDEARGEQRAPIVAFVARDR